MSDDVWFIECLHLEPQFSYSKQMLNHKDSWVRSLGCVYQGINKWNMRKQTFRIVIRVVLNFPLQKKWY